MFLKLNHTEIGYHTVLVKSTETTLSLGEVCLLIGNNGVGKTTLIKSILNQIPILSGEIFINQKNIKGLFSKEIAEQVAVVFSKYNVPANFTVSDLVALGKYIHYPYYFKLKKEDKEQVSEIIKSLNLQQYENTALTDLSDGNLQKAFIGRALAQNSPMIILDEPTTHLDEENKIIILKLLRTLAKEQNKIILFSSHDWRLAKEFSDKIWLIKNKTLQSGIAEDILLANSELSAPQIFELSANFVPPQIVAPNLQKELLISFLQKNYKKDLSSFVFTFKDDFWLISKDNYQQKVSSFIEILDLV
ncbi:MAG: ABC transporter ATP-binding protein [Cruoricaptor ignavus]|nr:ABC transporter ATP-binding protein [Cruoricaptor ignavus]